MLRVLTSAVAGLALLLSPACQGRDLSVVPEFEIHGVKSASEADMLYTVSRSVLRLTAMRIDRPEDPSAKPGPDRSVGRGSAVLVDASVNKETGEVGEFLVFLTAQHCMDGDYYILEGRGGTFLAKALFRGDSDWGVLVAHNPGKLKLDPVDLFNGHLGDLAIYDRVWAIGFALGGSLAIVTDGRYQGIEDGLLKFTAPVIFGNSGGALIGLVAGKPVLLGIVVALNMSGSTPITHLGYAVPMSTILKESGQR